MARTMSASEPVYRAYVKIGYFDLKTDKPFLMNPGQYEFTEQERVNGPYSTKAPAKRQLKGMIREGTHSREWTENANRRNEERRKEAEARGERHWDQHREWYSEIVDFGIDMLDPAAWQRVEGK